MLDLMTLLSWVVAIVAVPALTYLGVLTLLSHVQRVVPCTDTQLKFVILVPAHNEAAQITDTVKNLLTVDYPKDRFTVAVVADNCSDQTAHLAQEAGATVLTRTHLTERGKGYALHFAFTHFLALAGDARIDAIAVIDADSIVSPNLLQAYAKRLLAGEWAVQADYGVRNPWASWRTRLMAVALAMFHRVRGLGRERLGLSAGLRGNGMCFSHACLTRFPHDAHGLVEDVEYGIQLGLGGARIAYCDEAHVLGEMVSSAKASESQRERWEGGRKQLIREQLPKLLVAAARRRSLILFDLAIDLAVPPLGKLAGLLVLGWLFEIGRIAVAGSLGPSTYVWTLGTTSLGIYVIRGMRLSGLGMGAVTALLWAPLYLVWKVVLAFAPKKRDAGWVRTERESETKNDSQRPR